MNKTQRKYAQLLDEALEETLGLKVQTNNAQKLQRELGGFRVWARKKGETRWDKLTFRALRPANQDTEFLHIVKKLEPDEIKTVNAMLLKETQDGPSET